MRRLTAAVLLVACLAPGEAAAWWNKDWPYRRKVTIAPVVAAARVVPVRLHIANFPFEDARPDGADLRFVSADDKTPLNFHFEFYDGAESIAVAWVQVPPAGSDAGERSLWIYFGNKSAAPGASAGGTYDAADVAILHFAERDGAPRDATSFANHPARFTGRLGAGGVIGAGARLARTEALTLPAAPSLDVAPGKGFTFSAWLKLDDAETPGLILSRAQGERSLELGVAKGRLYVQFADGKTRTRAEATEALRAGVWQHVALSWSERLVLYVGGREAAAVAVPATGLSGELVIGADAARGAGFAGEIDELQLTGVARPAAWIAAAAVALDPDTGAVALAEEETGSGSQYFAVLKTLVGAVSAEGWVIIALIGLLGLFSGEIMLHKLLLLRRIESGNEAFLERFRAGHVTQLSGAGGDAGRRRDPTRESSLAALYDEGVSEYRRQAAALRAEGRRQLAPANLEVIKASIESTLVHEAYRMNRWMVLLTLAVSAAPFLGLLGTVVGIMITFGAIALAGDVNVNTIAPGVAAALTTTVAGLAVAIPVMFGYNYLATKVRELTMAMEVFANELVGRLAATRIAT
jgi:biopolymer transport protein ExbB